VDGGTTEGHTLSSLRCSGNRETNRATPSSSLAISPPDTTAAHGASCLMTFLISFTTIPKTGQLPYSERQKEPHPSHNDDENLPEQPDAAMKKLAIE